MSVSRDGYYENRVFAAGELAASLRRIESALALDPGATKIDFERTLADGTTEQGGIESWDSLDALCDLVAEKTTIAFFLDLPNRITYTILRPLRGVLHLSISAVHSDSLSNSFDVVERELELVRAEDPGVGATGNQGLVDRLQALERSLDQLTSETARRLTRLRFFLSYRFTPRSQATAAQIEHFLGLLGVEVLTASAYEPKGTSKKVRQCLSATLDATVLLVSADGESMWTRDEIAFSLARGLPVVPLVENGAKLEPGLFGDLEYIPFGRGHPGDAFTKLTEAVNYVRARRDLPVAEEDAEQSRIRETHHS